MDNSLFPYVSHTPHPAPQQECCRWYTTSLALDQLSWASGEISGNSITGKPPEASLREVRRGAHIAHQPLDAGLPAHLCFCTSWLQIQRLPLVRGWYKSGKHYIYGYTFITKYIVGRKNDRVRERDKGLVPSTLYKNAIHPRDSTTKTSSKPNHFPKAPPVNTKILTLRDSTYGWRGGHNSF